MASTEWTLITLKEHIELIIDERDKVLKAAFSSSQIAFEKADSRLDEILQGFPQSYARKDDFESLRAEIGNIKADHVQRREFDGLKEERAQGRGVRITLAALSGIMLALIAVALGAMYANQLTNNDVSNQIDREAPWLADKPAINAEIISLQRQVTSLKFQLSAHEASDRLRAALSKK